MRTLAPAFLLLAVWACTSSVGPPPPADEAISPAEERARMRNELASSGPTDASWTESVPSVFERWKAKNPKDSGGVEFSAPLCFARGCIVTATYPDNASFLLVNQSLPQSEPFLNWPGPRYRSPSEETGGKVVADWVLFAPEE